MRCCGNQIDRLGTHGPFNSLGISHNKVYCLAVKLAFELQFGHQVPSWEEPSHPPAR